MSTTTSTMLIALDDDPLGGVLLAPGMTFGVRAATLAGHASELTGSGDWWEIAYSLGSCSMTFTPPEPDQS